MQVDAIIYLTGRVERLAGRVAKLQVESCREPTVYFEDNELHGDGMRDHVSGSISDGPAGTSLCFS